jgi:hypothetical protein
MNAVLDALINAGVPREVVLGLQMPLTSERVWGALQARA